MKNVIFNLFTCLAVIQGETNAQANRSPEDIYRRLTVSAKEENAARAADAEAASTNESTDIGEQTPGGPAGVDLQHLRRETLLMLQKVVSEGANNPKASLPSFEGLVERLRSLQPPAPPAALAAPPPPQSAGAEVEVVESRPPVETRNSLVKPRRSEKDGTREALEGLRTHLETTSLSVEHPLAGGIADLLRSIEDYLGAERRPK